MRRTGKAASRLELSDLDVRLISAFLDHLENERHNTVRTQHVVSRAFFVSERVAQHEHRGGPLEHPTLRLADECST